MSAFNPVTISGASRSDAQPTVYVKYGNDLLQYGLPFPNNGNIDPIPGFMYLMADLEYGTDQAGNVRAVARNKDGSLPT